MGKPTLGAGSGETYAENLRQNQSLGEFWRVSTGNVCGADLAHYRGKTSTLEACRSEKLGRLEQRQAHDATVHSPLKNGPCFENLR